MRPIVTVCACVLFFTLPLVAQEMDLIAVDDISVHYFRIDLNNAGGTLEIESDGEVSSFDILDSVFQEINPLTGERKPLAPREIREKLVKHSNDGFRMILDPGPSPGLTMIRVETHEEELEVAYLISVRR